MLENVRADLRHYSRYCYRRKPIWRILPRVLYSHPASVAVVWYRFGKAAWRSRIPFLREILKLMYLVGIPFVRQYAGAQIHLDTKIGPGLVILHFGGVVLSRGVEIGENALLHHNVNIVTMRDNRGARIGSHFYAGVGVIVIEAITIEDHVTAGAGSVITKSVPRDAVVAGVPAKILRFRDPREDFAENKSLGRHTAKWMEAPINHASPPSNGIG